MGTIYNGLSKVCNMFLSKISISVLNHRVKIGGSMKIIYKKKSKDPVELIVSRLKDNLESTNFGILWALDLKDKINSKGIEFENDYLIFEICNPQVAKEILNIDLDIGVFLPCKVVVYRESNETVIGMAKPTMLVDLVDTSARKIAVNLENQLKEIIDTVSK